MHQSAERRGLVTHIEQSDLSVYAITIAREDEGPRRARLVPLLCRAIGISKTGWPTVDLSIWTGDAMIGSFALKLLFAVFGNPGADGVEIGAGGGDDGCDSD